MLEVQHVSLGGGLVVGGRANANDLAGTKGGELELEGKHEPVLTGGVGNLELVGEFVQLVDEEDLGNDVEIFGGRLGLAEG